MERVRVLYITDGGPGGVSSHVRCLTQCLKGVAEVKVCITYRTTALKEMLEEDGTPYVCCDCKNGHDLRLLFKVRKVIREFKPEVIHFHDIPLLAALYVKMLRRLRGLGMLGRLRGLGRLRWLGRLRGLRRLRGLGRLSGLRRLRVFSTIHTPSASQHVQFSRAVLNWAVEPCYWLPVSGPNWNNFKTRYPKAKGEVFFNPVKIGVAGSRSRTADGEKSFVVGMVGRNAEVKDWPSFCAVAQRCERMKFVGVGVSEDEAKAFGEDAKFVEWKGLQPNGREWIGRMDLLLLTSFTEEMPTVILEAFQVGTPVCGFIPRGGMSDILALSNGALKEVFIEERDPQKLAEIVQRLTNDADLRRRVIEDGWQILTQHFDAEKNCRGRLMELYRGDENA